LQPPWQLKATVQIPGITHVIGRAIGVGVRPEHINDARRSPAYCNERMVKLAVGLGIAAGILLIYKRKLRA